MILLQIIHEIRKLVHIPLTAENEIYSFVIILEKHNYFGADHKPGTADENDKKKTERDAQRRHAGRLFNLSVMGPL